MTYKERLILLRDANVIGNLSYGEIARLLYWDWFNWKKIDQFYARLQDGCSAKYSYLWVKNNK